MIPAQIVRIIGENIQKSPTILRTRRKLKNPMKWAPILKFNQNFQKQSIASHFSGDLSKNIKHSPQNLPRSLSDKVT